MKLASIYCQRNKLVTEVVAGLRRRQELVSVYLTQRGLQAVVYAQEEHSRGVSFTYSKDLDTATKELYYGEAEKSVQAWYREPEKIIAAIRELAAKLEQEDYELEKLTWLFALEQCAHQETLELPLLPKQELEEAIAWEIPQRVPWEKESYVYKYMVDEAGGEVVEKGNTERLTTLQQIKVYAVPTSLVEAIRQVCQKEDLLPGMLTLAEAWSLKEELQTFLQQVDFYENFYQTEKLAELRQQYQGALALVKYYVQGHRELNFFAPAEQKYAVLKQTRIFCQCLSVVLLLISIALGTFCWCWHSYEVQKMAQLQEKYAAFSYWGPRMEELQRLQGQNQRLEGARLKLQQSKIMWSQNLVELGKIMPRGSWLTKIEEQEEAEGPSQPRKRVLFNGKAENMELVSSLIKQLASSKNYKNVELVKTGQQNITQLMSSSAGKQILDFSIRAELNLPGVITPKTGVSTKIISKERDKHGNAI